MASKTVFILSLAISAAFSENAVPAVCDGRRRTLLTEEQVQNFTYNPKNLEAGPYFEGDIEGIPDDIYDRNGIIGVKYRWPNNTLVYSVDGQFTEKQLEYIREAQSQIIKVTDGCIKFRQKNANDKAYVSIINGGGCSSAIGYQDKKQYLRLSDGCFYVGWGTVAHEYIHALGFYHQQSSSDRDDWVSINWSNIEETKYVHNFCKWETNSYGEEYDYDSVMHYPTYTFAIAGTQTIVPKRKGVSIGQRDHISEIDASRIMKMYGCSHEISTLRRLKAHLIFGLISLQYNWQVLISIS